MWINIVDEAVPTYGKHGQAFLLCLCHKVYYGHRLIRTKVETVVAIWDSVDECFYEKDTGFEINTNEIVEWWKDI